MDAMNIKTIDWRKSLRVNHYKTILLTISFFLLYVGFGLILDSSYYLIRHANFNITQWLPTITSAHFCPYITICMCGIAIITLGITILFPQQVMLLGTQYSALSHENAKNIHETTFCDIVDELSIAASLTYQPKIFIIEADFMNAFVSGYSEKTAFIAATRGLITKLTRTQLEGIVAHELSHIKALDIRLTLIASTLAHIMVITIDSLLGMIFSMFSGLMSNVSTDRTSQYFAFTRAAILLVCAYYFWPLFIAVILLRILLPPLNFLLLLFLNRTREYMADAGAIELLRESEGLSSGLLAMQKDYADNFENYQSLYSLALNEKLRREAYIFDPSQAGFMQAGMLSNLVVSHPRIKDRIHAIGVDKIN